MARDMVVDACKKCTAMYTDRGGGIVPCQRAHQKADSEGSWVFTAVEVSFIGSPCFFRSDWKDELLPALLGRTKYVSIDVDSKGLTSVCMSRMSVKLREYVSKQGRSVLDYPERLAELCNYRNTGVQSLYNPGDAKYVILRAKPNDTLYKSFLRAYQREVALSGKWSRGERWVVALTAAAANTPGEFGTLLKELIANPLPAIGILVLFAGAIYIGGIAAALAVIIGGALDRADYMEAAGLFAKAAKTVEEGDKEQEFKDGGIILAQAFAKLAVTIAPAAVGAATGKAVKSGAASQLLHWFTKKSPAKWKEAAESGATKDTPRTMENDVPRSPEVPGKKKRQGVVGDATKVFGPELKKLETLKRYYTNEVSRLEELAMIAEKKGNHARAAGLREVKHALMKKIERIKSHVQETAGHIQVVQAAGTAFKEHLKAMGKGKIHPEHLHNFLRVRYKLTADEATKIKPMITELLDNIESVDFMRHDLDHGGPASVGKLSVYVAERMSLLGISLERLIRGSRNLDAKFKTKNPDKLTEAELKELAIALDKPLSEIETGLEITRGIYRHRDFAHHCPKTPLDWLEFGIDQIAARAQWRDYKGSSCPAQNVPIDDAFIRQAVDETKGDPILISGWAKIGRAVLSEFHDEFVQMPQHYTRLGQLL